MFDITHVTCMTELSSCLTCHMCDRAELMFDITHVTCMTELSSCLTRHVCDRAELMFAVQDENEKLKLNKMKLEDEKNHLLVSFNNVENQLMKTELLWQSSEGDVQQMKLALNDRETENQLLNSQAEHLTRQIDDLEKKADSLTTTVDRLNLTLAKTEQQESAYKNEASTEFCVCVVIQRDVCSRLQQTAY